MDDRYAPFPAVLEKAPVGLDQARRDIGGHRHGGDLRIQMPAVAINGEHRRVYHIDAKIDHGGSPTTISLTVGTNAEATTRGPERR